MGTWQSCKSPWQQVIPDLIKNRYIMKKPITNGFFCWKKNHMDNRSITVLFLTGDHKIGGAGAKAKPDPPCSCRASAFFKTQTIRNKPFLIP